MRTLTEIEVDVAALDFHRLNPELPRSVELEFKVAARLVDDAVDLLNEVKRLRAESQRVGLVAARNLAEKYNRLESQP